MKAHITKASSFGSDEGETRTIRTLEQLISLCDEYKNDIIVKRTKKFIVDVPYNRELNQFQKGHDEIVPNEIDIKIYDDYLE